MYTKFFETKYQPFRDSSRGGWQYYYHTSHCLTSVQFESLTWERREAKTNDCYCCC